MSNPDIVRRPAARNRGQRHREIRDLNQVENPADNHFLILFDSNGDTTDEAGADWGPEVYVDGFERFHLFADFTHGGDITAIHVGMQTSQHKGSDWYDVHSDEAGDGVLVRKVFDLTTAVDAKPAWSDLRRVGRYMRFKAWTDGSDRSGSALILRGARVMDGH